eukprot:1898157-Karenia_brevis.AAC.1
MCIRDSFLNERSERWTEQCGGFGGQSSQDGDAWNRNLSEDIDKHEVRGGKYWSDQVAILRCENADLFYDLQWALSQAELLKSDCSNLRDENMQLWLQLCEAERAIGAWTAHCGSLEDCLRWRGGDSDLAFRVDVLEQRLDKA